MANLKDYQEELDAFGARVIARAQANLRKKRTIRGRSVNRVDTGNLGKKLTFGYFKRGPNILQWFGVPASDTATRNYADVIEKGRRASDNKLTWPPVRPIYEWMQRKKLFLPNAGPLTKGAQAWKMSESIGRRGIVGIYYMRDAFESELRKSGKDFRIMYQKNVIKQVRLKADKYIK
jgi:hypothetical protein